MPPIEWGAWAAESTVPFVRPRLGLALGSGSARGWAHIGVIRALQEAGIEPDIVCGTSAGALVGASYVGGELDKFEVWVRSLRWHDVFGFFDIGLNGGLIKGEKLMAFLIEHFVDTQFDQLNKPFACVATNLATGREVWLREGDVAQAVRASLALPGLFSPCVYGRDLLVDGALVNPLPVSLCRAMGAEIVIAVDLGSDLIGRRARPQEENKPLRVSRMAWQHLRRWVGRKDLGKVGPADINLPSMLDVVASSINIMQVRIARSRMAGEPADVLVTPRLAQLGLFDYDRADESIDEGMDAMRLMIPRLRSLLGEP